MHLTKNEKKILKGYMLTHSFSKWTLTEREYAAALFALQEKGLIESGNLVGGVYRGSITPHGDLFLKGNPELKNPINWEAVMRWVGITTLILAGLGLFIGCVRLLASY